MTATSAARPGVIAGVLSCLTPTDYAQQQQPAFDQEGSSFASNSTSARPDAAGPSVAAGLRRTTGCPPRLFVDADPRRRPLAEPR
jgi:hypothetical protein